MDAKARIRKYLKYKDIVPAIFYKTTGLSNGFLKTGAITSDKLAIISEHYIDLNLTWVITGKGEMLIPFNVVSHNLTGSQDNQVNDPNQSISNPSEMIAILQKRIEELEILVAALTEHIDTLRKSNHDKDIIIQTKDELINELRNKR